MMLTLGQKGNAFKESKLHWLKIWSSLNFEPQLRSTICKLIYDYQNHGFDHPRLEEDFNDEQFLGH